MTSAVLTYVRISPTTPLTLFLTPSLTQELKVLEDAMGVQEDEFDDYEREILAKARDDGVVSYYREDFVKK